MGFDLVMERRQVATSHPPRGDAETSSYAAAQ